MNRTFIVIGGIVVVVIVAIAVVGILGVGRVPPPPAAGTVEVWGIEDADVVWQEMINRFQAVHPNITVTYQRFDAAGYENLLVNRLAEGKGPDVFFLPHTWVTKHHDKLFPLPSAAANFSVSDFKNTFVDAAADDLVSDTGEILGMPLYMDTLALFYNKDIFNAAGIAVPPKTWDEVAMVSHALTRVRPGGDIQQSGIALGTGRNTEHSFEIVSALMLQKNAITRSSGTSAVTFDAGAADAMALYTSFSDPTKSTFSWSGTLPNSFDAFAQGQAAMTVGFSRDALRIRDRNPHLNFAVAPLPQISGISRAADWGEYFFPAVSKASMNKEAAWQFVMFAASRAGVKPYLDATHRPSARRDLVGAGTTSEDLAPFWQQSLIARSWPVPDDMPARRVFNDAIDSVVSRTSSPNDAITRLESQLRLLAP